MNDFTIGYIKHSPTAFERYLGYSLKHLQGDFDEVFTSDEKFPAQNYNDIIERSQTEFVILTHEDVSFPPDALACIKRTIDFLPDFGVLGMVGVDAGGTHRWSTLAGVYEVDTLDCCFVVVRKNAPARFDAERFNEYHLYVEDYCAQMNRLYGKKNHTLHIASGEARASWFVEGFPLLQMTHHSATVSERGYCWGRYHEFRHELERKWPNIKTT
jgi:hypothetical protein